MDALTLARAAHVLGVVLWIGGVALVATVLLPMLRAESDPAEALARFHRFARRFAAQARFTTLLTGLTGFYMVQVLDAWNRYGMANYWWFWGMLLLWVVFSLILFVVQPISIRRPDPGPPANPARSLRAIHRVHVVLLVLSLLTVAGAVTGAHGLLWL